MNCSYKNESLAKLFSSEFPISQNVSTNIFLYLQHIQNDDLLEKLIDHQLSDLLEQVEEVRQKVKELGASDISLTKEIAEMKSSITQDQRTAIGRIKIEKLHELLGWSLVNMECEKSQVAIPEQTKQEETIIL